MRSIDFSSCRVGACRVGACGGPSTMWTTALTTLRVDRNKGFELKNTLPEDPRDTLQYTLPS